LPGSVAKFFLAEHKNAPRRLYIAVQPYFLRKEKASENSEALLLFKLIPPGRNVLK
jgi:hypothetical protein